MPRLQYMATLSQGVGHTSPLVSKDNVTAFIPTDIAFNQISRDEVIALFANRTLAEKTVRSHVVQHLIDLDLISVGMDTQLTNLAGDQITLFKQHDGRILVISPLGIARIVGQNIQASNGIIHVVDTVL
ncbi:protein sll1483-like [Tigriopus californicus]|uniref:protein sll1483-like n=1 Tax=Tigriopus californicus TaxID=6832 RepID=UPI0027DA985F|nr:protein sll1483-like [Tigriopus californicus]